ncbi:hypothetical protein A2833_00050 [Candidatus Azambacteria bacterium RIFCSPHIGHO2_01_FULL_44_55]|uniref:Ada DNA repair metal-binding domain-containing protein n=1 Tax=Candidatus Azambacteria bacterium RIFCSPLOWO2_02_FULL_44_14 TaxID=1797306 RepID=A0A1F5CBK5_9BACT|nr:MAG: hypothetical protein A3A18_01365 [Candidatus Azambacteria bacterium RIFCSPLOWO2_01_FULL_44_84]OGD33176.1 MAG: hypothetical protein A3C78_02865 [Candidatus Azambacteria bacterium RIFCSPHIGHO2_02_FULL_45_18]OGD40248.1 MAG: hypothetical protein A2833_00050 [Candidatus Azambacteria bacterium RIFCSPHIGHO2_01_FULL_44_55]OGD40281.1 MAG: hypothetical protein A3I30_03225 [Candidatus Azambacteria bacterium RIFCSPLOWO2_02_FULL_44_14]OGD51008.1 MAG: hypothetical protein A2608_03175 [Candidatus Azam
MNFRSTLERGSSFFERHKINIALGGAFFVGIFLGLGLAILTAENQPSPIIIDQNIMTIKADEIIKMAETPGVGNMAGDFIASINGKNYYPAECAAAYKIKKENQIRFKSAEEARSRGYVPSKSCAQ